MPKCINKVIVFDLDDTIGHFEEISVFLYGLQNIFGKKITDKYVHNLLDLWPKFLRLGIIDILETIKKQKKKDKCVKAVIYTNNMGPRRWTMLIKDYLEKKINYPLFDKVITAYRPNDRDNCRTSHNKSYNDLIKCTGYSNDSKFLFLDDQNHPYMRHKNITYLYLAPYNYGMQFHKMINSFINSKYGKIIRKKDINRFKDYMFRYLNSGNGYNKYIIRRVKMTKKDIEQLRIIKKQMRKFLNIKRTRNKKKKRSRSKTRKNK
jgi:hypothetical protein